MLPGLLRFCARTLCRLGFGLSVLLLLAFDVLGQGGTPHSITVSWSYAQGARPAAGFNVYRGTISGGPYTKRNATPLALSSLSYKDTSGVGGTRYFYVVTAVDAASVESSYSPEISGIFMANPVPPTGLTVTVVQRQ